MLFGQVLLDTLNLPVAEIKAKSIRLQALGQINQVWTTEELEQSTQQSLAELLARQTGIFTKTYGLGSIATTSIRGGSAGHTTLLWNGLPIQSPMLGLLDLSLLPIDFSDEVTLQYGGGSALWGSGAIGGVIGLNNKTQFDQQSEIKIKSTIGSFGSLQQQARLHFSKGKWQSNTNLILTQAENDFIYELGDGSIKKKNTNANLFQRGLQQQIAYKINDRQHITARYWHQFTNRFIPPTTVQNKSEARQKDWANRFALEYEARQNKIKWSGKAAYFDEQLLFIDPQNELQDTSGFQQAILEWSGQWYAKENHQLFVGLTNNFTRAYAEGYGEDRSENRFSLFSSYRFQYNQWQAQLSLRQGWIDDHSIPLVPSLAVKYQFVNGVNINGKISKNYRLATLNDRYWIPGGNPDLLPENGWSQEISVDHEINIEDTKIEFSLAGFNRNINNWILWSVREGDNFWSANNLTQVWSRGLEQRLKIARSFNHLNIRLNANYYFTKSTNQKAIRFPRLKKDEQIIYSPVHRGFVSTSVSYFNWQLAYRHQFTSEVIAVNTQLASYNVGSITLNYQLNHQHRYRLFFDIDNVWDAKYRVVERRAMPGRNFRFGIQFIFNHKT